MKFDKQYIVQRQGKDMILYEGLLDEAHRQGIRGIRTTLIQLPHKDNDLTAVMTATVTMPGAKPGDQERSFDGIGDASPKNVGQMILPHLIRMAETRAKARALRDAINAKGSVDETDFSDSEGEQGGAKPPQRSNVDMDPSVVPLAETMEFGSEPDRREPPTKTTSHQQATAPGTATTKQMRAIQELQKRVGDTSRVDAHISSDDAARLIKDLSSRPVVVTIATSPGIKTEEPPTESVILQERPTSEQNRGVVLQQVNKALWTLAELYDDKSLKARREQLQEALGITGPIAQQDEDVLIRALDWTNQQITQKAVVEA